MSTRIRILVGLLISLVVVTIAIGVFVSYQIQKSYPVTTGALRIHGPLRTVTIIRDDYGTPYIQALSEHDAMFALGFVHAQDRLWEMDMGRRIGEGRLSEILGEKTLPFDRMFRIVGLRRIAEETERSLLPDVRVRLQAYADGVNACIRQMKGKLPVEFDMLRYEPEEWSPVHSILLGKVLAWELNLSWWTDLTYGALVEKLGPERVMDIYPSYPANVPAEVPAELRRGYAALRDSYLSTAHAYATLVGTTSMAGGSNAWVTGPTKSLQHKTLLANDTHLRLQSPSQWYEVYLYAPPYYTAGGMSMPGIPAIIVGRNDSIAWGVTNAMADDADFYVERIDSTDSTRCLYDGRWEAITVSTEEINVRGQAPIPLTIRSTRHGPVVTDIRTSLQHASPSFVASMRWTGRDPDDQLGAFDGIARATNWRGFTEALRKFPGPGQNFVYGDVRGNIGYYCALKLPIRPQARGILPQAGWDRGAEWQGYVPFDQLPHMFNPPTGFIASANNKIADDNYPYFIGDLWEPSSRIQRLREVLGPDSVGFSSDDFQRLQVDAYSVYAREMTPFILGAFKDSSLGLPEEDRVFDYLRNWNYTFAASDLATSIYQGFLVKFVRNVFADEMGEDLFHDWVTLVNVPLRVLSRLVRDGNSPWFDDARTAAVESRDDMIRKSLREAIASLTMRFGSDMRNWRWGDLHTVTLRHHFGLVKPLDRVFNLGPYPFPGGSTALISGEYGLDEPFDVTVGPSFRMIMDFSTDNIFSVIPGGECGQVYNRHYGDQTAMWLNGAMKTTHWRTMPEHGDRLTLEQAP